MTEILDAWKKIFKDRPMEQAFELGFKAGQESNKDAWEKLIVENIKQKARQDFAEEQNKKILKFKKEYKNHDYEEGLIDRLREALAKKAGKDREVI